MPVAATSEGKGVDDKFGAPRVKQHATPLTTLNAPVMPLEMLGQLSGNLATNRAEAERWQSSTTSSDQRTTLIVTFPTGGSPSYLSPTSGPVNVTLGTTSKTASMFKQPGLMAVVFMIGSAAVVAQIFCVWSLMRRRRERQKCRKQARKYFIGHPTLRSGSDGSSIFVANVDENKLRRLGDEDERMVSGAGRHGTISGGTSPYLPSVTTSHGLSTIGSARSEEPSINSPPGTDTRQSAKDESRKSGQTDWPASTAATDAHLAYDGVVFTGVEDPTRLSAVHSWSGGRLSSQDLDEDCFAPFASFAPPDGIFLTATRTSNPYNSKVSPPQGPSNDSILSLPLAGSLARYTNLGRSCSLPQGNVSASRVTLPTSPRDVQGGAYVNRAGSNNSSVPTTASLSRALSLSSNFVVVAPLDRAISDTSNVLAGTSMQRATDNISAGEQALTDGGTSITGDASNMTDVTGDELRKSFTKRWMPVRKTRAKKSRAVSDPEDVWSRSDLY